MNDVFDVLRRLEQYIEYDNVNFIESLNTIKVHFIDNKNFASVFNIEISSGHINKLLEINNYRSSLPDNFQLDFNHEINCGDIYYNVVNKFLPLNTNNIFEDRNKLYYISEEFSFIIPVLDIIHSFLWESDKYKEVTKPKYHYSSRTTGEIYFRLNRSTDNIDFTISYEEKRGPDNWETVSHKGFIMLSNLNGDIIN